MKDRMECPDVQLLGVMFGLELEATHELDALREERISQLEEALVSRRARRRLRRALRATVAAQRGTEDFREARARHMTEVFVSLHDGER